MDCFESPKSMFHENWKDLVDWMELSLVDIIDEFLKEKFFYGAFDYWIIRKWIFVLHIFNLRIGIDSKYNLEDQVKENLF